MSKTKENSIKNAEIVEETPLANPQGKTVEELKEIAQTLQAQLNEHQRLETITRQWQLRLREL